ncbi:MAG: ABC transporter permease [Chloroflexota bacterium]
MSPDGTSSSTEPSRPNPLIRWFMPLVGVAIFVLLWWLGTTVLTPESSFLRRFAPDRTATALVTLVGSGQVWVHLFASLRRIAVGLFLSASIGIPIGLALGGSRRFAQGAGPMFQFLRMVSPLSWTPLAIILLGVGDAPVYFLIAIAGVWPIALNTAAGVAALDPRWLIVGRSLRASRLELARAIVWPGIRPHVLTGLRLTVGLAWIVLVPAEMLGVDSGLGYFILDTRDRLAYSELMAAIIVVGVCGFLIDSLTRWVMTERRAPLRASTLRQSAAPETGTLGASHLTG